MASKKFKTVKIKDQHGRVVGEREVAVDYHEGKDYQDTSGLAKLAEKTKKERGTYKPVEDESKMSPLARAAARARKSRKKTAEQVRKAL